MDSIDAIVTDPPYGLSFMNKSWDYEVPQTEVWRQALRVLKPGGHLLSFFGTRTYHRGVIEIEDAGFEIRDQIMWIYGSGFPKSHNISKSIDKQNGSLKEVGTGESCPDIRANNYSNSDGKERLEIMKSIPNSELAKQWQGWGTALKPANEPIVVARKPLEKGLTIAQNVLKYGTGAINIDDSRIGTEKIRVTHHTGDSHSQSYKESGKKAVLGEYTEHCGRWPANILFDEAAAETLDQSTFHWSNGVGPSRFFYVAKASKRERNAGLEGMEEKVSTNHHPTVKPIKLMEYLIKLVTPPKGTVLDPFMGSGSTGVAAKNLGFNFIGCEMNAEYIEIAKRRYANSGVNSGSEAV
jgi:DNA modification methylase